MVQLMSWCQSIQENFIACDGVNIVARFVGDLEAGVRSRSCALRILGTLAAPSSGFGVDIVLDSGAIAEAVSVRILSR